MKFPSIFQRWHSHHIMFFYITSHCITFTSRYIMSRHITFIYMYLYLIWEQFLFFRTKLIVQAYDEVGHRVQVLAVCSGLTHLVRGSLRGFSPAGHWPQSEERLCTSSGQSDRSVKLVSPVCARLTCEVSQRRDSACFLGPDIGHSYI